MVGDHPCLTPKSLNGQVFKGTDNLSFDVNDFFHGVDESSEECSLTDCKVTSKTKNSIVIQAQSAGFDGGDDAKITKDGQSLQVTKTENGLKRGLHIAVINPTNG